METPDNGIGFNPNPKQGQNYFFGIAIGVYEDPGAFNPLYHPVDELQLVSQKLFEKYNFSESNATLLFNGAATKSNITKELAKIRKRIGDSDNLLIYFTGHGLADYWACYDSNKDEVEDTCILTDTISIILKPNQAKYLGSPQNVLIIADCCRNSFQTDEYPAPHKGISDKKRARQVLCSCEAGEKALNGAKISPFAASVLEVLENNSINDLEAERFSLDVKELTKEKTKKKQTPDYFRLPHMGDENGGFIFQLKNKDEFTKSYIKPIEELASFLAYNHVNISFGDRYMDENSNIRRDKVAEILDIKKLDSLSTLDKCRNIAIIGAGMTYDAFNVLPYGEDMVRTLLVELDKKDSIITKKNKNKLNKILEKNKNRDFEKDIKIIAKYYDPDEVKEVLKQIYNIKFRPNLSFEIVAHLTKHGFIDAIINYNFDELMDKAIDSEIGPGTYYRVISESDSTPLSDIVIDGRIKVPLYIKPHGTASNQRSIPLDPTQEEDRVILPSIIKLMENLLGGHLSDDTELTSESETEYSRVKKINLICLGFSMQCDTLNSIIREMDGRVHFNIFHFNIEKIKKKLDPNDFAREYGTQKDLYQKTLTRIVDVKTISQESKPPYELNAMSLAMYELWTKVNDLFNPFYKPRGIDRHEIVSSLFYDVEKWNNDWENLGYTFEVLHKEVNRQYFFDRTVIELAIIICRNKGLVDPKEMTGDKFGRYFKEYRRLAEKDAGLNEEDNPFTLYDFLRHIFRMREHLSFSGNVYNLLAPTNNNKGNEVGRFMDETKYPQFWSAIRQVLNEEKRSMYNDPKYEMTNSQFKSELGKNIPLLVLFRIIDGIDENRFMERERGRVTNRELTEEYMKKEAPREYAKSTLPTKIKDNPDLAMHLYKCLKTICERQQYDIHPKFYDPRLLIFDSFKSNKVLNTEISLMYEFLELFKSFDKWDAMLVLSERGRFITDFGVPYCKAHRIDISPLADKKIINICCHDALKIKLRNLNPQNTGLEELYKRGILKINEQNNDEPLKKMEVLSLPYYVYNHHMCVFMKAPESGICLNSTEEYLKYLETQVTALYYYHSGFQHKINPVLFQFDEKMKDNGVYRQKHASDLKKMLETFYALTQKGRDFKKNRSMLAPVFKLVPEADRYCHEWDKKIYDFINTLFPNLKQATDKGLDDATKL